MTAFKRRCDDCGTEYIAKSAKSRFCSSTCRLRAHKKRAQGVAPVTPMESVPSEPDAPASEGKDYPLVASVRRELDELGIRDTSLGQRALVLAARISVGNETGAAVASLDKQLGAVMEDAHASIKQADRMDEVTRRRDEKLRRARGS